MGCLHILNRHDADPRLELRRNGQHQLLGARHLEEADLKQFLVELVPLVVPGTLAMLAQVCT